MSAMRKPRTKITEFEEKDLSIRAIEVRPEILQSRHTTDIGFSRAYAKAMANGSIFPPVLVFFDGEKYWLADGFTRVHARESLGLPTIRATIRPGTIEDALLAGIAANFDPYHSRSVAAADREHAAELMIRNERFRCWPDTQIAKRTGASRAVILRLRLELQAHGVAAIPERVIRFSGDIPTERTFPYSRRAETGPKVTRSRPEGYCGFTASVNGERLYLGDDPDIAESRLREEQAEREEFTKCLASRGQFATWAMGRKILLVGVPTSSSPVGGRLLNTTAFEPIQEATVGTVLEASARLMFLRAAMPEVDRLVIVGYVGGSAGVTNLLPIAARLGIEVMTPKEFLAKFGPKPGQHLEPSWIAILHTLKDVKTSSLQRITELIPPSMLNKAGIQGALYRMKQMGLVRNPGKGSWAIGDVEGWLESPQVRANAEPNDELDSVKVQTMEQFLDEYHAKGDDPQPSPAPSSPNPEMPDETA